MTHLTILGWWLLWAAGVPMAVFMLAVRAFPPRTRRYRWDLPGRQPVKVISVQVAPSAPRRELEAG